MVRVSEKAAKELLDMDAISKDGNLLRMYITQSNYGAKFVPVLLKEAKQGDTVIESKGIKVAYDPVFEDSLKDIVIDMAPEGEGERFCAWNPKLRYEAQHKVPVNGTLTINETEERNPVMVQPAHGATGPEEQVQIVSSIDEGKIWPSGEEEEEPKCGCCAGCDHQSCKE
jgi:Fe-S cluster assembly iron-binding protein IscA